MASESAGIGGSKLSYELFGCKLRFRLGREVIWRHDAKHRIASDGIFGPRLGENGRTPVPRFAQVRDNRKLRDISHDRLGGQARAS
jgi:hypothetical protein